MQNWNQWQVTTGSTVAGTMPQPPAAPGYPASGADPMATMQAYMQYYNQPAPSGYTADQWAAAQQQNWAQWQQWQQQYQQWQAQYGAKYQESVKQMSASGITGFPAMPMIPPPLPKDDSTSKPPLPPDNANMPPPHQNNLPLFPSKSAVNPPLPPGQPPPPPGNPPSSNEHDLTGMKRSASTILNTNSAKKLKNEDDELTDAEKTFDAQFKQWEEQFNKWKQQNANHPDKAQYKQYEAKWTSWREKLIERREQMRKKREAQKAKTEAEKKKTIGGDKLMNILSNTENQGLINNLLGIGKTLGLSGKEASSNETAQITSSTITAPAASNMSTQNTVSAAVSGILSTATTSDMTQQVWAAQQWAAQYNMATMPVSNFSNYPPPTVPPPTIPSTQPINTSNPPPFNQPPPGTTLNTIPNFSQPPPGFQLPNTQASQFSQSQSGPGNNQDQNQQFRQDNKSNIPFQNDNYDQPLYNDRFNSDPFNSNNRRGPDHDQRPQGSMPINRRQPNDSYNRDGQNRFNDDRNDFSGDRFRCDVPPPRDYTSSGGGGGNNFRSGDTFESRDRNYGNDRLGRNDGRFRDQDIFGGPAGTDRHSFDSNFDRGSGMNNRFGPEMDRINNDRSLSNDRLNSDNTSNMNRFDSRDSMDNRDSFGRSNNRNLGRNNRFVEPQEDISPELKKLMEKRRAYGDVFKPSGSFLSNEKSSTTFGSLSDSFKKITGDSPFLPRDRSGDVNRGHSDHSKGPFATNNEQSHKFNDDLRFRGPDFRSRLEDFNTRLDAIGPNSKGPNDFGLRNNLRGPEFDQEKNRNFGNFMNRPRIPPKEDVSQQVATFHESLPAAATEEQSAQPLIEDKDKSQERSTESQPNIPSLEMPPWMDPQMMQNQMAKNESNQNNETSTLDVKKLPNDPNDLNTEVDMPGNKLSSESTPKKQEALPFMGENDPKPEDLNMEPPPELPDLGPVKESNILIFNSNDSSRDNFDRSNVDNAPFKSSEMLERSDSYGPRGSIAFGPRGPDSFRHRGPDSFGPRGPDSFGPRGPGSFGPRGPDSFGPRGPDSFGPRGPDFFGPRGPDSFRARGPDSFGPRGLDTFGPRGPDSFGPRGSEMFGLRGPDSFGLRGPDSFGLRGPDSLGQRGPDSFGPRGPDSFGQRGADSFGPRGLDSFDPRGPDAFDPSSSNDRFSHFGPGPMNNPRNIPGLGSHRGSTDDCFGTKNPNEPFYGPRGPSDDFDPRGPNLPFGNRGPDNLGPRGQNIPSGSRPPFGSHCTDRPFPPRGFNEEAFGPPNQATDSSTKGIPSLLSVKFDAPIGIISDPKNMNKPPDRAFDRSFRGEMNRPPFAPTVMDENIPPIIPERDHPMRPDFPGDQFNENDKMGPPHGGGPYRSQDDPFLRPADPLPGRPPFGPINSRGPGDHFNEGPPSDMRDDFSKRLHPDVAIRGGSGGGSSGGGGGGGPMRPEFCIEKQYNYNHGGRIPSKIHDDFIPSKVIDYGHIRRPVAQDYITPVQCFEYLHGKNKPSVPDHEIFPRMEFKHWIESEHNLREYHDSFKAYEDYKKQLKRSEWKQHRNEPAPVWRYEERNRYDDRKPIRERDDKKKKKNPNNFKEQRDYKEVKDFKDNRNKREREQSWEREIEKLNEKSLRSQSNVEDRTREKSDRSLKESNTEYNKEEERSKGNISRAEKSTNSSANSAIQEFSNNDGSMLEAPSPPRTLELAKISNITMVADILYPPGRQNRPPKIVIILRGPPGSGKSYVAKLIKDKEVEQGGSAPRILSLDDYFLIEKEVESSDDNGKKIINKEMVYEYEEAMEQSYVASLVKAFKKNIIDGFFNFIILDCINERITDYEEMWSFAKSKGFRVYVCEMEMDVQICLKRNVHKRTEDEINRIVDYFEPTPSYHQILDVSTLLQEQTIEEVQMEEVKMSSNEEKVVNANDDSQDSQEDQENSGVSKWERMEAEDKLDRLDGLAKRKNEGKPQTMEDFLQVPDYYNMEDTSGKKRVRWADLEERKEQEKMRAVGFVVGQTNWNRMMDPTKGSSALIRTKYI